ncbi:radical SAM protein [Rhodovulum sulfidophilum]|uniref:radical SAM protein n=1 Tax=Rhodovulum sulfidophilum TaxID=35806 RepID=UPI00308302F2
MPFCSVPLRLDSYSNCQFGCQYCFSKARGGSFAVSNSTTLDNRQLKKRLQRAAEGNPRGATEEFIQRRIPMQFGGMNDPFGPSESKKRISLETLKILAEYDYPTIISTKGTILASDEYLSVVARGNFYVRISVAAVGSELTSALEPGVPSVSDRMKCAKIMAARGVPVSLRLQPIIPEFEKDAERLIVDAADHGFKHVSAEYLKLPVETAAHNFAKLQQTLPGISKFYAEQNATRVGREFILPTTFKKSRLIILKEFAEKQGLVFGFAENELLLQNDFSACCNASDLFLRDANYFNFNIAGILRSQMHSNDFRFAVSESEWFPSHSVFSHLNSKSRVPIGDGSNRDAWIKFLKDKWNAGPWRGGPASFDGVTNTGSLDDSGNCIYRLEC